MEQTAATSCSTGRRSDRSDREGDADVAYKLRACTHLRRRRSYPWERISVRKTVLVARILDGG